MDQEISALSVEALSTENEDSFSQSLQHPFQKIALALSGGGFRAASYSIGTMSYLEQVPYGDSSESLMDKVVFISSASGGTFAGMLYSMYAKLGWKFIDVYNDLLTFMNGQGLLEDVLKTVNDDSVWTDQEKTRNFINAFALAYDEKLLKHRTFSVYWETNRPLEVCFNATEFYRGLSFRFQTNGIIPANPQKDLKTGNQYIYFDKTAPENVETLKQLKLGDILASSSCFPGGFEPIAFPVDFSYKPANEKPGLSSDALRKALVVTPYNNDNPPKDLSFGLMDGGVDDNQALYSAMTADDRWRKKPDGGFDLIIVTDVASYFIENPYVPPTAPESKRAKGNIAGVMQKIANGWNKFKSALKWVTIIALAALVASVVLLVAGAGGVWTIVAWLLLSPAVLLIVLSLIIKSKIKSIAFINDATDWMGYSDQQLTQKIKQEVPAAANFSNESVQLLVRYIRQAPLGALEQMMKARLNSLLSMAMDINLKQTRRLIFEIFYTKQVWDNRRVFNVIYELSTFNIPGRQRAFDNRFDKRDTEWYKAASDRLMKGCEQLNGIAEEARTMGTTLWYDSQDFNDDRMKRVVACGQFTACAKLVEYILITEKKIEREKNLPDNKKTIRFDAAAQQLFNTVKAKVFSDWDRFKAEPFFLYDEYQQQRSKRTSPLV